MIQLNEVRTFVPRTNLTEVVHHPEAVGIVEGSTEVTTDLTQELKDETEKRTKPANS